jgi:Carboxypeptidase regulatory-like domain
MRTSLIHSALLAPVIFLLSLSLPAQEPASQTPPSPAESSSQQKPGLSPNVHSNDFLVRGTVFTQEGLALPGAELRIRRAAEKKFRWQTVSNSRGDFAVRVKMGADYEVTVRAKGYREQSLPVDAKTGDRFKDLVFRMQHQGAKKS